MLWLSNSPSYGYSRILAVASEMLNFTPYLKSAIWSRHCNSSSQPDERILQLLVRGASVPSTEPNTGAGPIMSLVVRLYQSNEPVKRLLRRAKSKPMSYVSTVSHVMVLLMMPGRLAVFCFWPLISHELLCEPTACC